MSLPPRVYLDSFAELGQVGRLQFLSLSEGIA